MAEQYQSGRSSGDMQAIACDVFFQEITEVVRSIHEADVETADMQTKLTEVKTARDDISRDASDPPHCVLPLRGQTGSHLLWDGVYIRDAFRGKHPSRRLIGRGMFARTKLPRRAVIIGLAPEIQADPEDERADRTHHYAEWDGTPKPGEMHGCWNGLGVLFLSNEPEDLGSVNAILWHLDKYCIIQLVREVEAHEEIVVCYGENYPRNLKGTYTDGKATHVIVTDEMYGTFSDTLRVLPDDNVFWTSYFNYCTRFLHEVSAAAAAPAPTAAVTYCHRCNVQILHGGVKRKRTSTVDAPSTEFQGRVPLSPILERFYVEKELVDLVKLGHKGVSVRAWVPATIKRFRKALRNREAPRFQRGRARSTLFGYAHLLRISKRITIEDLLKAEPNLLSETGRGKFSNEQYIKKYCKGSRETLVVKISFFFLPPHHFVSFT